MRQRIATLMYATAGAVLFTWLGIPLQIPLGPMASLLIVALAQLPLAPMGRFGVYMQTFLGIAIGSTITPEPLASMPTTALSLAFVVPSVAIFGTFGFLLFRRIGYDRVTSFYAAMPGGLQDMLLLGEAAGGNVRAMSLIHATRVLIIFVFVPLAVTVIWELPLDRPPG